MPAITGILPLTISIVVFITFECSLKSRVADSPVVPTEIITSVLFFTWNYIRLSSESKSSDPSTLIGVAIATILPLKILIFNLSKPVVAIHSILC